MLSANEYPHWQASCSFQEKASKIAQIQKLQREIEAKKRDDQIKVIARKPKPLPKPRPQKRKVDDEAEKPKPKKQPKLDFFL